MSKLVPELQFIKPDPEYIISVLIWIHLQGNSKTINFKMIATINIWYKNGEPFLICTFPSCVERLDW